MGRASAGRASAALVGLASLLILCGSATAKPGDLIVGDPLGHQIARVDPDSGRVTQIAAGAELPGPNGVAFQPRRGYYVAEFGAQSVIEVSEGGDISTLSDDPRFDGPLFLDRSPDGSLYVGDRFSGVFEVNPRNGATTSFSRGGELEEPAGVEVAHNGSIFVSDIGDDPEGNIYRLDRSSGAQTEVASSPVLGNPFGLGLAPNGILYAANSFGSVVRIDPKTGATTTVASGPQFNEPFDVAVHPDGFLYVAQFSAGNVVRVNPHNGAVVEVADEGLTSPEGIEVQPPRCKRRVADVVGSERKDKLKGSRFRDVIAGLGGNDKLKGVKGNDRICGGKGKDTLTGGKGKDRLSGGKGRDRIRGGPGNDKQKQ